MDLKKIPIGKNPPRDVNVIIEIPLRGDPVKYEICKESGAMYVDRFLNTAMYYPVNYGFVPHTLSADGDPVDVMVVGRIPVAVGSVMRSRPIGVLLMEDEAGMDEKILAVPHSKLHPFYDAVNTYEDLPKILVQQIEHFFVHYKDLEVGKWVQLKGWGGPERAGQIIQEAIDRAVAEKPKKKK
ncbi:inorganic pyrophosphatase [Paramagnetospirillum caucaseum]|uniref:Inorganic pyrophosphatase n=1 Tax=Paramagnetospirillum caucaseum TaxID=1244869 RepID=M2Z852_9PROT|nr:inorganic diphosphatase [Paramagnetospirillum caucaseum]EME70490.1 inorganic pyrophosphatase [Paramagnetospirillum caucaseum]